MPALADQLHAIWVCTEIPFAGGRLLEKGVERILVEYRGNCASSIYHHFPPHFDPTVPIIVVLRSLMSFARIRGANWRSSWNGEAKRWMTTTLRQSSMPPWPREYRTFVSNRYAPYALGTPEMGCNIETTIADLVNLALELTKIENVWIEMAIAQRSNAQASIDASIRVGRKRYWCGLISDIFLGFTMRSVLEVLQKDIVNVWNMHDPEKHLQKPEFLALLLALVEDLSDEATNNYPLTEKAVQAIIENPAAIVIAGPTAIFVLFAEWVRGTYKKTKSSVCCVIAFIIDLTLTMDTLFYLVLSRGQTPIKIALVNTALRIYNSRKAPVHASITA
ncbi:hypothetical protein C8J57DRAFT_277177 [Mycena rebaudengoi]|nr:hypothetical protein C8J57DRAFT_277177 [Mycena rebaudengoi]